MGMRVAGKARRAGKNIRRKKAMRAKEKESMPSPLKPKAVKKRKKRRM